MIRPVLALAFRTDRGNRSTLLLPVIAFAIVTALLIGLIGGAQTFWQHSDELAFTYQMLAVIALSLLVVPLGSLGGAAARLSARRRDERLSTLRLLGVPSGTVRAATIIESSALAVIGALVGVVLSFAVLPLIGLIHFRGEALGFAAVLPAWWVFAIVVAGIALLAAVSSVLGLRGVVISPLGVRTRQDAPRLSWVRALIVAIAVAAAFGMLSAINAIGPSAALMVLIVVGCFGGTLALLNLVGPWYLAARANAQVRRAQTPSKLLAARRVTEDPKAAWRQVSGVAMASFMAVFAGTGVSFLTAMDAQASDEVTVHLVADMRTGVLITVLGSFLMVACAVGVSQAADILDRREFARSLTMLGTPLAVLDGSRRRSVMSPLITTSLASAIIAAVLIFPIMGLTIIVAPLTLGVIAAVLAIGCVVVWLSLRATGPLQRSAAVIAA